MLHSSILYLKYYSEHSKTKKKLWIFYILKKLKRFDILKGVEKREEKQECYRRPVRNSACRNLL